jgi:hypothetical protein
MTLPVPPVESLDVPPRPPCETGSESGTLLDASGLPGPHADPTHASSPASRVDKNAAVSNSSSKSCGHASKLDRLASSSCSRRVQWAFWGTTPVNGKTVRPSNVG